VSPALLTDALGPLRPNKRGWGYLPAPAIAPHRAETA
jgi:hypothetical protein